MTREEIKSQEISRRKADVHELRRAVTGATFDLELMAAKLKVAELELQQLIGEQD